MAEVADAPVAGWPTSWRGWLPAICMVGLLVHLHPLLPNRHFPDAVGYVWNAALLALAVGTGLSACRSRWRGDRLLGSLVGGLALVLVGVIVADCVG